MSIRRIPVYQITFLSTSLQCSIVKQEQNACALFKFALIVHPQIERRLVHAHVRNPHGAATQH
jgi:hypothetical protein